MAKSKAKRKSVSHEDAAAPRPRKRKQDEDTVATARPSKKRKAAVTSKLKIKELANVEDDETDVDEPIHYDDEEDVEYIETPELDTKNLKGKKFDPTEATPIIAPGFRLWETNSQLMARGGETLQVTKVNRKVTDYSRVLDVHYPEVFTLVPVRIQPSVLNFSLTSR
jgi:hypothetical protein